MITMLLGLGLGCVLALMTVKLVAKTAWDDIVWCLRWRGF